MKAVKTGKLAALEAAIAKQAESLDPAQREFVLAEFETYKWNAGKIEKIQSDIDSGRIYDEDGLKAEASLLRERHQLVTEQASLFSHIMRWLKGTAAEESALDAFLDG